jgi:hypothetical protein
LSLRSFDSRLNVDGRQLETVDPLPWPINGSGIVVYTYLVNPGVFIIIWPVRVQLLKLGAGVNNITRFDHERRPEINTSVDLTNH